MAGSLDLVIQQARIVDGMGHPWYWGSVGIAGGRVVAIGPRRPGWQAREVVDADGAFLAPGFIDVHSHADVALLAEPAFAPSLCQGVTTHLLGLDGVGYAPLDAEHLAEVAGYFAGVNGRPSPDWPHQSVAAHLAHYDRRTALNVAYLIPHGAVRYSAMGDEEGPPTPTQLAEMQALVAEGMAAGAVGVSTGLDYLPCRHAETAELVGLCQPLAEWGGVFVTHMRSYTHQAEAALAETAEVGRAHGIPVHVSHFNVRAGQILPLVDRWRAEGVDLTYDTYPYLRGCTTLLLWLPPELHRGRLAEIAARLADPAVRARWGAWFASPERRLEALTLSHVRAPEHQRYLGLTLAEAVRASGRAPVDFLCDLLLADQLETAVVADHSAWRGEADVQACLRHPAQMVGSDGIYVGQRPHPRGWATYARVLAHYVRDQGVLTLEEAVRKMAGFPARRFGLVGRGVIAEGAWADLCLFRLEEVEARATFAEGRRLAGGMRRVWVNGVELVRDGAVVPPPPGRPWPGRALRYRQAGPAAPARAGS